MGFRWVKDQKVEANLRNEGLAFETETIQKEDMDLEEGLRRQARMQEKLNQEYVLQLSLKMLEDGAAFPMTIFQRPPRGKLWPWSGNHRLAAFFLAFPDAPSVDAYTVTVKDPVMMELLPRIVNVWESGIGYSKEEKIINARWFIEHHSMPTAEAAQKFGVKPEWIYSANSVSETKKLLEGLPKVNGFSKSVLQKLHPLAENTNVLRAAAKLLCDFDVKGDEAYHLIVDVRRVDTELQKMAELGRWEKLLTSRLAPVKTKRVKGTLDFTRTIREKFMKNITALAKIVSKADTLSKLQLTDPADLEVVRRAWKSVREVLEKELEGRWSQ